MYEIIANPKDYEIQNLIEGVGVEKITFDMTERKNWAREIHMFSEKLDLLSQKARELKMVFESDDPIEATPAALKTLKIQLFHVNDAVNEAFSLASKLEKEIIPK